MPGTTRVGFAPLNEVRWGTHICQFYRTPDELLECVVPFVATGLERGEKCLWITSPGLPPEAALRTLEERRPDVTTSMRSGQLQVVDHASWFTRNGTFSGETVFTALMNAERGALAEGYPGLRMSADTAWMQELDGPEFTRYDQLLHRELRGRNLLCLRSYSLAKCGPDQIVDALHDHSLALVRRGNAWELIGSATSALAATSPLHSHVPRGHAMHLYGDRGPLADVLAEWVHEGAQANEAAILLVGAETRSHLERALSARDLVAEALRKRGAIVVLHAEDVLTGLLVNGKLDAGAFERVVASVIRRTATRHPGVRVFTELVDLLWRERRPTLAVEMERMWNRFREEIPFRLLCAYDGANTRDDDSAWLARLYDEHDDLQASSAGPFQNGLVSTRADGRNLERRALPTGRIAAQAAASRRISLLQSLTAALSEAMTYSDIAHIASQMREAVGSVQACLFVRSGESLHVISGDSDSRDVGIGESDPVARAVRSETPIWIPSDAARVTPTACLPLTTPTGCVGALRFRFPEDHELLPEDRALLLDLARQTALAIQRVRLLEHAQATNQKLETASNAKDEFLAILGHELRNPLSPMLTALELIKLRGDGTFARERETIERQLRHIVSLVDDLFDVSRIARGKVELCREPVDLITVIEKAVEMTSGLHAQKEQHVDVIADPGVVVDGDPRRLAQVLSNLLTNASRYTPPGGAIMVTASREADTAVIEVRDTGIGMTPDVLARIFDPFVQGPPRGTGAEGLGVGLTIVRRLVDLHGGTVQAASPGPNRGSTLTVRLPALGQAPAPRRPRPSKAKSYISRRILLVDDNFDFVMQMSEAMRTIGHDVQTATDGPSALSVALANPPDIALVDIGMPFMDGYELAQRFHQDARLSRIPLVAFTGYGQETDRARTKAFGFSEHLVKPADIEMVALVVDRLAAPPQLKA